MKKITTLLLAFAMVFALCACGGATVDSNEITNETQAINTVKNFFDTPERICDALGFVMYSNPDYGVCSAGEFVLRKVEKYFDGPDPVGKTHIREGVVARVVNRPNIAVYKHKNFSFKVLEGIAKDEAVVPDMEEVQDEVSV